jgi:hypothetical protein
MNKSSLITQAHNPMKKMWRYLVLSVLVSLAAPVFADAPPGCSKVANAKMVFMDSLRLKSADFGFRPVGKFRVTNNGGTAFSVEGVHLTDGFYIPHYFTGLEIEGKGGAWKPAYIGEAGAWAILTEVLTVKPGASVEILVSVYRDEQFAASTAKLRAMIGSMPQACIVSDPFVL